MSATLFYRNDSPHYAIHPHPFEPTHLPILSNWLPPSTCPPPPFQTRRPRRQPLLLACYIMYTRMHDQTPAEASVRLFPLEWLGRSATRADGVRVVLGETWIFPVDWMYSIFLSILVSCLSRTVVCLQDPIT
jgi:hypothetical protein